MKKRCNRVSRSAVLDRFGNLGRVGWQNRANPDRSPVAQFERPPEMFRDSPPGALDPSSMEPCLQLYALWVIKS